MLVAGKLAHVGADLVGHHQRGLHVDAVDAREIRAAHLEQPRAQVELGRIARLRALLALGRFTVVRLQALQSRFDLAVALGQVRAAEVEGIERPIAFGVLAQM